jgi:hypothetical protein
MLAANCGETERHVPHEVDVEVRAELEEELVHLPQVGGVPVGVEQREARPGLAHVHGHHLRAALGGQPARLHAAAPRHGHPAELHHLGVRRRRFRRRRRLHPVRRRGRREEREPRRHRRRHGAHRELEPAPAPELGASRGSGRRRWWDSRRRCARRGAAWRARFFSGGFRGSCRRDRRGKGKRSGAAGGVVC